jgi:hypothetical protein
VVDAHIDRNSVQPCVKGRLEVKLLQITVDLDEHFLTNIHAVISVFEHPVTDRINPALILFDELPKSIPIPLLSELYEFLIVLLHNATPTMVLGAYSMMVSCKLAAENND